MKTLLSIILTILPIMGFSQERPQGAEPEFVYEGFVIDPRITEYCMENAKSWGRGRVLTDASQACIGLAASACMDANDIGGKGLYSNRNMTSCAMSEGNYWMKRVDSAYSKLKVWAGYSESIDDPRAPFNALINMQNEWAEYRVARCISAASKKYGGAEARISEAGCHMRLIAEHALYLEFRVWAYCGSQHTDRFDQVCPKNGVFK